MKGRIMEIKKEKTYRGGYVYVIVKELPCFQVSEIHTRFFRGWTALIGLGPLYEVPPSLSDTIFSRTPLDE
jgi:hypothetical protein